jgi:AraC-like DNA-binding protein
LYDPPVARTAAVDPRYDVPLLPVEELVYATASVGIGRFACSPAHPQFRNFGPATTWCIAFPLTSAWIYRSGCRPFVADATLVTMYNRADEYERSAIDPRGDFADWFAIAPDVLRDIASTYDPRAADNPDRPLTRPFARCHDSTRLLQRMVCDYVRSSPAPDPLLIEERVLEITASLLSVDAPPVRPRTRDRDIVELAREVLARRFTEALTIPDIAAYAGSSPFHLCRAFRAATGMTIARYRDRLRLSASLGLLRERPRRITDVALELGYNSHSHFGFAFRRTFGLTPSQFTECVTNWKLGVG